MSPANLTPGMWRLVAKMPLNSQMALAALGKWSVKKPPPALHGLRVVADGQHLV